MYEPIMVPPRDPRRTKRIALIVVGVVLVACCLGGAITGFWLLNGAKDEVPQIRSAASSYLDAVQAGDVDGAYGQLCNLSRSRVSQDSFAASMPSLRSYEIVSVTTMNEVGNLAGFVKTHLTLTDDTQLDEVIALVKEDGRWRVCNG